MSEEGTRPPFQSLGISYFERMGFVDMSVKADIGLIGLAVMGENLVMNMAGKGFTVAVFNRTTQKVRRFTEGRAKELPVIGTYSLAELAASLSKPRKVMMMVKAGQAVDSLIEELLGVLEAGDIIIDGGNSYFPDTARRMAYVESRGLHYIGTGVSGGEEGALKGPSMMPGGSAAAWPYVKNIFQAICAKVQDTAPDGTVHETPCCEWVGAGGAGHFVKMVHNGIEYGDMQIICEAYQIMRDYLCMKPEEMSAVFGQWNEEELNSYLVEITRDILAYRDEQGRVVLNDILDAAGQKGTGKWTSVAAYDEGVPLTLIGESVFARCLSAMKDERATASKVLTGGIGVFKGTEEEKSEVIRDLRSALYASKIVSYAQGYALMRKAAETYGWELHYGEIAMMWRGGCIIRSAFLSRIKEAFAQTPDLPNLMLNPFFAGTLLDAQAGWRRVCAAALLNGIPVPAFTAALSYFDGYRCAELPANLLQAQRDYFGAHTYERKDAPRGTFFHTNWTGCGGDTASSAYNA